MTQAQACWPVKIVGDVTVCVYPTIHQMSSYVLLEQEDWFEDEMDFVRAFVLPDMNVLDIGANHGVYSLSIARKLETGHVWAFEPTLAPGQMLARSIELNDFSDKVTWVHAGLSDHQGSADIRTSINSELNSLYGNTGEKETIRLETLDSFLQANAIEVPIEFVKLDAEGEEINVLRGGHQFFSHQSPLIMFELKHGHEVNHGLIEAVQALGYTIYRLLPDMDMLIEYEPSFQDGYLLNLFACKPEYATTLAARGLLVRKDDMALAGSENLTVNLDWMARIQSFPFAKECEAFWMTHIDGVPKQYLAALSVCLQAYDHSLVTAKRAFLLQTANNLVDGMLQNPTKVQEAHPSVWLLKLHLLHVQGYRSAAVALGRQLVTVFEKGLTPSWPFIPPAKLFFARAPKKSIEAWILAALQEFVECRQTFSSYFAADTLDVLQPLLANPNHSLNIDRRLALCAKRAGKSIEIAAAHPLLNREYSPNSAIWCEICGARLVR